jgi:hypothetical protein
MLLVAALVTKIDAHHRTHHFPLRPPTVTAASALPSTPTTRGQEDDEDQVIDIFTKQSKRIRLNHSTIEQTNDLPSSPKLAAIVGKLGG